MQENILTTLKPFPDSHGGSALVQHSVIMSAKPLLCPTLHQVPAQLELMLSILFQDLERGGISDRADDECDVYHTFFGIAGLSLLGFEGLEDIDPVYALPTSVAKACIGKSVNADAMYRRPPE